MSGTAPPVLYAFEDGVARVTINWPDPRNAQSREVMGCLLDAFDRAGGDLGRDAFCTMPAVPFDPALADLQTMLTIGFGTEDAIEGMTAFLQKRAPAWKGR